MSSENIKEVVKEKYGEAALRVQSGARGALLRKGPRALEAETAATRSPQTCTTQSTQEGEVPETAMKASLGCGNPTALAELKAR